MNLTRRQTFVRALVAANAIRMTAGELKRSDGSELIGQEAPPLRIRQWLHSAPLEMSDLRGKVVLLRWWTVGCPMCDATGPALRKLEREYGDRGLRVIGIFHPKPPGKTDLALVEEAAQAKQFRFPIGVDADWGALNRWWLDKKRDFTSVSFVVDRKGIIRYVQPGGEFHEGSEGSFQTHESCNRDYRAVEAEIARLVKA